MAREGREGEEEGPHALDGECEVDLGSKCAMIDDKK
jgi:hypothetical protein